MHGRASSPINISILGSFCMALQHGRAKNETSLSKVRDYEGMQMGMPRKDKQLEGPNRSEPGKSEIANPADTTPNVPRNTDISALPSRTSTPRHSSTNHQSFGVVKMQVTTKQCGIEAHIHLTGAPTKRLSRSMKLGS